MEQSTLNPIFCGIDVGKDSLQIALKNVDGQWQDLSISNEIKHIETFLSGLNLSIYHFIYEPTGTYCYRLGYCLELMQANYSLISPNQSKGFAQSLKSSTKTDKSDARMLCIYGQKMQPACQHIESETIHQKKQKYAYLSALKTDKQAFENRKHALEYDPRRAKSVLQSINIVLQTLSKEIDDIQAEVFTINEDESQRLHALITSVVGIGDASCGGIIIATNGLKDFDNVKQLSKFLGLCPSEHRSGTSVFGKKSVVKAGNSLLKATLYMAARSARKYNLACKDIYERLRLKGKAHKVAMMAVVHKLIKQVFAVVKNNTIFDNTLILAK